MGRSDIRRTAQKVRCNKGGFKTKRALREKQTLKLFFTVERDSKKQKGVKDVGGGNGQPQHGTEHAGGFNVRPHVLTS